MWFESRQVEVVRVLMVIAEVEEIDSFLLSLYVVASQNSSLNDRDCWLINLSRCTC